MTERCSSRIIRQALTGVWIRAETVDDLYVKLRRLSMSLEEKSQSKATGDGSTHIVRYLSRARYKESHQASIQPHVSRRCRVDCR